MNFEIKKINRENFKDIGAGFICILSYLKRLITNIRKMRPDMPKGYPGKIDIEFMKYIWNFPETSRVGIVPRLEK